MKVSRYPYPQFLMNGVEDEDTEGLSQPPPRPGRPCERRGLSVHRNSERPCGPASWCASNTDVFAIKAIFSLYPNYWGHLLMIPPPYRPICCSQLPDSPLLTQCAPLAAQKAPTRLPLELGGTPLPAVKVEIIKHRHVLPWVGEIPPFYSTETSDAWKGFYFIKHY